MKKSKQKSIEKARKAIRASVEESLINTLQESVSALGHDPKKLKAEIAKASRLIAKRIAAKAKISQADIIGLDSKSSKKEEELDMPEQADRATEGPDNDVAGEGRERGRRIVRAASMTSNGDPVALAKQIAQEKASAGEPDLDEELGA